MEHNGGIETRPDGEVGVDHRPALRSGERATAYVTVKQLTGVGAFGDRPMHIKYAFRTADEKSVLGQFTATESSFFEIEAGDEITVRYSAGQPHISVPEDALSIIRPFRKAVDVDKQD